MLPVADPKGSAFAPSAGRYFLAGTGGSHTQGVTKLLCGRLHSRRSLSPHDLCTFIVTVLSVNGFAVPVVLPLIVAAVKIQNSRSLHSVGCIADFVIAQFTFWHHV